MGSKDSKPAPAAPTVSEDRQQLEAERKARESEQQKFFERMAKMQADANSQEARRADQRAAAQDAMHERNLEIQRDHSRQMMEMMQANAQAERDREARYMEMLRSNPGKEAELERANQELVKKLEDAEAQFAKDASEPEKYEEIQVEIFQNFCNKVEQMPDVEKTRKPSVAVMGPSGVGKSSLINALVGKPVTPVGIIETTMVVAKCYESDTTEFWDVPGQNEERSYANLRTIMAIKEMHFIIMVYTTRVDSVVKTERMIKACKVPYIVVRNKIDVDFNEEEAKTNGFASAAEYVQAAYTKEKKSLSGNLIFVSTRTGQGIDELRPVPGKYGVEVKLEG